MNRNLTTDVAETTKHYGTVWKTLFGQIRHRQYFRRRRRDCQSDGASRSGAKRPQNWIRWSLDADSLTMGGAAKMEIMKILEIITPDDLLTNINSNQSRVEGHKYFC